MRRGCGHCSHHRWSRLQLCTECCSFFPGTTQIPWKFVLINCGCSQRWLRAAEGSSRCRFTFQGVSSARFRTYGDLSLLFVTIVARSSFKTCMILSGSRFTGSFPVHIHVVFLLSPAAVLDRPSGGRRRRRAALRLRARRERVARQAARLRHRRLRRRQLRQRRSPRVSRRQRQRTQAVKCRKREVWRRNGAVRFHAPRDEVNSDSGPRKRTAPKSWQTHETQN